MTKPRYTAIAMTLHWLVAVMVIVPLVGGQSFAGAEGAELRFGLAAHSSIGLTILGLMLLRLLWRLANPPPPLPAAMPAAQKIAAHAVHGALYAVLIALPVTGLLAAAVHAEPVMPFGLGDIRPLLEGIGVGTFLERRALHELLTWVLMGLIGIHIAAAAFHVLIQDDNVLWRMLPGRSR